MTPQADQPEHEKWAQLYSEREEQSRRFLEKIDQLEASLATSDHDQRNNLQRDRENTCRLFAQHLGDQNYVQTSSSRTVTPVWLVTGVPSKKHKDQAKQWMKQRGIEWTGSAPPLRHEVRKARERNETIPEHSFGLKLVRTVDIKEPRAVSAHLFGKLRHFVVPADVNYRDEIREERLLPKYTREDN